VWTPRFDLITRKITLPVVGADHGAVYSRWMAAGKKRAIASAALVICQSRFGIQLVRELGGNAVLMYNGVNSEFFVPDLAVERDRFILAIGRFVEPQKRFADLLEALRSLPGFRLVLVGSGPDQLMLKQLAAEYGLQDRVQFPGFMSSREQLRELYQQCGVFVSTSKWEAVALVMLEAMSCGAAVVGSRIPSFEELLTHDKDGLLFPVGDVAALVESINLAWERRNKLGAAARETVVKHYSSATLYKRLSESIERLPLRQQ
jgi:glycosyltransferase involved in cell wall biosynthesis